MPYLTTNVPAIIVVILVGLLAFTLKLIQHRREWRRQNLPGPPHSFLWGHIVAFHEERQRLARATGPGGNFDNCYVNLTRQYGTFVCLDLWPIHQPIYIVADGVLADKLLRIDNIPKALNAMWSVLSVFGKHSLFHADSTPSGDAHWVSTRKSFTPSFRRGAIERQCAGMIVAGMEDMKKELDCSASSSRLVEAFDVISRFTTDVMLQACLSITDSSIRDRLINIFNTQVDEACRSASTLPVLAYLDPIRVYRSWKATRAAHALLQDAVADHIAASREDKFRFKEDGNFVESALKTNDYTVESMVDQVRTLAFAGQDTTATVSASCLYELSRHPEVLTTLRAEMDGVFGPEIGQEGHQIRDDPSILARCFYLNAVIKEGLRIWVPTASARDAEQDYMFSHNNRLYRKGSGYFHISSTAMHMHPDHFHSPDKFDPSRWFDAEGHPITMPITFMPFSKGPKGCLGIELAWLELRCMLAMLVRSYDFSYPESEQPPYLVYRITARPSNSIPLIVRKSTYRALL